MYYGTLVTGSELFNKSDKISKKLVNWSARSASSQQLQILVVIQIWPSEQQSKDFLNKVLDKQ